MYKVPIYIYKKKKEPKMESGNSDGGDGYPTDHLQKSVEIDSEVMDEDREAASY